MEKITNIEIKNFKSIRHQKIDGCKRINVFVGKPNVGKSNILEALSLFSLQTDNFKIKDIIRVEKDPTIFFDGLINQSLSIKINEDYIIEGKYGRGELIFRYFLLNRNLLPPSLQYGTELSNLPLNFKIIAFKVFEFASILLPYENRFQVLTPLIKKYEFKSTFNNISSNYDTLNYPFGENIFAIIQANPSIRKEVASLLKVDELEMLYDTREQEFTILKRTNSGIFTVPFELLADTLKRLFYFKAVVKSNFETVLLLEEPESHMYPPYISKFTSDIIYDENDNQYFIATHSPYVLNDFMEDAKDELSIYLVDYKDGETLIYRMSDEEMHDAYQFGYDFFLNMDNFMPHKTHEQI